MYEKRILWKVNVMTEPMGDIEFEAIAVHGNALTRYKQEAKRAREAEKYWKELATKLDKAIINNSDRFDKMEDTVKELEKENAELKKEINWLEMSVFQLKEKYETR